VQLANTCNTLYHTQTATVASAAVAAAAVTAAAAAAAAAMALPKAGTDTVITLWRCLAGLSSFALILRRKRKRNRRGLLARGTVTKDYLTFRRLYLVPYLFATAADWLKGPYIYMLYSTHYGYSQERVTLLFTTGYAAGACFGLFIGGLADKYGRRRACLAYGALQIAANVLACSGPHVVPLFLGRIASGMATATLSTAFEAWMLGEHSVRGYGKELLASTFAAATLANSCVAVASGLLGEYYAQSYGPKAAFFLSALCSLLCIGFCLVNFTENHGHAAASMRPNLAEPLKLILTSPKLAALGLLQTLFECSMYLFVLEWSPTLESSAGESLPHGLVFANFMLCVMVGSSLFSWFAEKYSVGRHNKRLPKVTFHSY
jgi:MFS transporter, MFS domain-containing protein family, molybdate-anion transporter